MITEYRNCAGYHSRRRGRRGPGMSSGRGRVDGGGRGGIRGGDRFLWLKRAGPRCCETRPKLGY